jgi:putative ABC transport system permease protein
MLKAALRGVLARKVRFILTSFAVVLGVGFVAGTYVLTDTMTRAFDDLVDVGTSSIDVLVRSSTAFNVQTNGGPEDRKPIPEAVLAEVRRVPGVAEAVGDVAGYAQIVDPATGKVIGTLGPPTAASSWNNLSGFVLKAGSAPHGPGQVVIDASTAESHDIRVGERVRILFASSQGKFKVVGIAGYGNANSLLGATWALFDLPTAQRLLGRQGQFDSISVVAVEGVSATVLRQRIADELPKGLQAVTAATVSSEYKKQISQALGYVRRALLVFAFVALFVGAFLIFNTFAIIVAQRTRELGLLRALGASGRQVTTSVVVEALVVGLVSSAVGFLAGIGIAIALKAVMGATGFDLPASGTVILARTFFVSMLVGTVVTVVAATVPARRAARVAPVEALREARDRLGRSLRFRLISGAIVLAAGVVPLLYGLFGMPSNALTLVGFGVAFTFIGIAMLTPLIARPVAGVLGLPVRRAGVPGKLGRGNSMRNPRRTAATASALMIGLGLVVFVAVFATSAKASVNGTLERTLKADLILSSPTFSGFSTAVAGKARAVPGVGAVAEFRTAPVRVEGADTFLDGVDPGTLPAVADVGVEAGFISGLEAPDTIAVSRDVADENGWRIGSVVPVTFPATGNVNLRLVSIYSSDQGLITSYAVSLATFEANVSQQLDVEVLVKTEPGASLGAVQSSLDKALRAYPNVEVQDQASFREKYAGLLNQVLNLLTALLLMAVIIAVFGVVNTLSLSIYERTRELGLIRAVGLTRRQTRSMVRWEAVIISVMGSLFGVMIGIAFGWALQRALAPQGFTEFAVPGTRLVVYVVLAVLSTVAFAFIPARRAARLDILEAIAYE